MPTLIPKFLTQLPKFCKDTKSSFRKAATYDRLKVIGILGQNLDDDRSKYWTNIQILGLALRSVPTVNRPWLAV
jgi:hypothetical protein